MVKVVWFRFQQLFETPYMLLVEECSETGIFWTFISPGISESVISEIRQL